ncbi:putative phage tail component-like protein [Bacillus sp. RC55]|uniref:distal tail protein Dit n=1 Tax=Bacillus sp. RC55 TaxID=3156292 RepID=UPI003837FB64
MKCLENLAFFSFNEKRNDKVIPLQGVKRPAWAPIERSFLEVPHYPGGRLLRTETKMREILIPVAFVYETSEEGELLKEELADWLYTDQPAELIFDDEKERTYLAVIDGELDPDQLVDIGQGVLKFICPMPYKLGKTQTVDFKQDSSSEQNAYFRNRGTVETKPIIELEMTKPSTNLDVWFGKYPQERQYFRIGQPMSIQDKPVQENERVLWDEMNNLVGWSDAGKTIPGMESTGKFKVNDGKFAFEVADFGETKKGAFTGPILKRSIPGGPLTDFRAEAYVTLKPKNFWEMGRVSMFLLDEQGDIVADINMNDLYWTTERTHGYARIGNDKQPNNTRKLFDSGGNGNTAFNNFYGRISVARRGKKWSVYFARFRSGTEIDDASAVAYFTDDDKNPMTVTGRRVAQIAIGIQRWDVNAPVDLMRIDDLKVWKVNQVPNGGKPYLLDVGDKVIIDTERSLVTINGTDAISGKDIFSSFPKVIRGENRLSIMPPDVKAKVTYRERYR